MGVVHTAATGGQCCLRRTSLNLSFFSLYDVRQQKRNLKVIINSTFFFKFSWQTKENVFSSSSSSVKLTLYSEWGVRGGPQSHLDNWKRQTEVRPRYDGDKRRRWHCSSASSSLLLFISAVKEVSVITPEHVTFTSPAVTAFQHPSPPLTPSPRRRPPLPQSGGFEGPSSHISWFQWQIHYWAPGLTMCCCCSCQPPPPPPRHIITGGLCPQ